MSDKAILKEAKIHIENARNLIGAIDLIEPGKRSRRASIVDNLRSALEKIEVRLWEPSVDSLNVLLDVRKKIEKPDNWTQGHGAVTASGVGVKPSHFAATAYCLTGALERVCEERGYQWEELLSNYMDVSIENSETTEYGSMVDLNDEADHAAVLSELDRIIRDTTVWVMRDNPHSNTG